MNTLNNLKISQLQAMLNEQKIEFKKNAIKKTLIELLKESATKKEAPKKKAVKSESVILKSALNNEWKKETFSMSGLVRYAKGKGEKGLIEYIAHYNKNKGSAVTFGRVTNIKNIVALASERELFKNANDDKTKGAKFIKGEAKTKFSYWLLLQTVGRLAKQEMAK